MGCVAFAAGGVFGPINVDSAGLRMSASPANLLVTNTTLYTFSFVVAMLMRWLVVDTRAAALVERCYV